MLFYYSIFFLIIGLLFISPYYKGRENIVLFIVAVILILVAGLRRPGVDFDSETYIEIFNKFSLPSGYFKDYKVNSFYEPAYYLIPSVISIALGLNYMWVFLTFAVIGISLKFIAIYRLSDFALLSALVYFSHFYILQDMTQIRAGVASAVLLLCIPEIQKRNLGRFLILILIGLLFHYSIIVFLPAYFVSANKINKKLYLSLLFVPFILHFFKFNIISIFQVFNLGFISDKIQIYNDLLDLDIFTGINIYNMLFLVQLTTCTIFILKSDILLAKNKYSLLLLKINCIGSACFVLFASIPVFAFRISELLGIVQIILMPFFLYIFKPKYVGLAMVLVFALLSISNLLIHVGLLHSYFAEIIKCNLNA